MLKHMGTQQLETNRLILRKYQLSDAADMYHNWVTDPEVCRFWSWEPHKNIEETMALLSGYMEESEKPNYYHWIVELKRLSQAIGYIYFADVDDENNSISVHYALSRNHWNQGIMTEACSCVIDFAFAVLGAEKVHSRHHVDNSASGQVLGKSGMRYCKTEYRQIPDCERISGNYCYYEMALTDWSKANGPLQQNGIGA